MTHELAISTSTELAHPDARRAVLAQLNQAAELATDPAEARRIMLQAKAITDLLESAKAPLEDARLAGRATVVAARKVGKFLNDADNKPRPAPGPGIGGGTASDRGLLRVELGLGRSSASDLLRLARLDDAQIQRYIQMTNRIPSVNGCLASVYLGANDHRVGGRRSWRKKRRDRAGVIRPQNPKLEEGYSLIVRALGHLSEVKLGPGKQREISAAIDYLYSAEDLLRPHLGGYTE